NIAIISRDYLLTKGTIFHFLTSGDKNKMKKFDDKIILLCEELGLNEKIIEIDGKKYQNHISKDDYRFSETEKLKLALVRAIYKDAPILILDNFWHGFDEKNKNQIKTFINKYTSKTTIIQFTSKKDDVLINTDKTYELEGGKLK
ncbi:hypothetical protein ACFL21_05465, partial [Patescibacteria group bacterium]